MTPQIVSSISERLKEALEFRDMKQSDLVKITGIDKGSISSYINGRYEPKDDKIYILSLALGVNPVWLSGFDAPMFLKKEESFDNDPKIYKITKLLNLLPDEALDNLLNFVEQLNSKYNK